jgi:hypothetical protein
VSASLICKGSCLALDGLARRTPAAASWPRFHHPSRTFGPRSFVRRRLGVWANAGNGGKQARKLDARSRKARRGRSRAGGSEGG